MRWQARHGTLQEAQECIYRRVPLTADSIMPALTPPASPIPCEPAATAADTAGFSLGPAGNGIPLTIPILGTADRPPHDQARIQTGDLPSGRVL